MHKSFILIFIAIIVIVGAGFFIFKSPVPVPNVGAIVNNNPVACTQEAKQCPDGSYVGRTGPNCEFTLCPNTQTKDETTAALNQKILIGGVFITPLKVLSDSRCPFDVQCIWAGEVSLSIKLEKGGITAETTINLGPLGTAVSFEGNTILLISVNPALNSKKPFPKEDYRFTFQVIPISATLKGTVEGLVTTSPTCPVERIPPDPQCAPRPYTTSIEIWKDDQLNIVKTIESDSSGAFKTTLLPGSYGLKAVGGQVLPRCNPVAVIVKSGQTTTADISCDTGIR